MISNKLIGSFIGMIAVIAVLYIIYDAGGDNREAKLTVEYQQQADQQAEEVRLFSQRLNSHLVELNQKHLKGLFNETDISDRLLDAISTGKQRVFIPAKKTTCSMPNNSTATKLDDGRAQVELDGAYAEQLFSIAAYGDKTTVILTGLQDYVRNVCLAGGNDG